MYVATAHAPSESLNLQPVSYALLQPGGDRPADLAAVPGRLHVRRHGSHAGAGVVGRAEEPQQQVRQAHRVLTQLLGFVAVSRSDAMREGS